MDYKIVIVNKTIAKEAHIDFGNEQINTYFYPQADFYKINNIYS